MRIIAHVAVVIAVAVGVVGCGGSGGDDSGGVTPPPTVSVGAFSIGADKAQIKTNNADTVTITATATDTSSAALAGVAVTFSTTSGVLSAATATTDANGDAQITLKSGTADASNRVATVTATAGSKTASIPIQINGSTLTIDASATSAQVGVATITFTATAKNAVPTGVNGQPVRFSIGAGSTGAATLSASSATTGVTGATAAITLTPTAAGTVVLTAEWLDASGAAAVTASKDITVIAAATTPFAITTPASNPTAISTGATQAMTVSVPMSINGTTIAKLRISASSGTWTGVTQVTAAAASIEQTPAANTVNATYTAPVNSGSVTIQVDAIGAGGGVVSSLSRTFAISATTAASVNLQASAGTIAPSSGTNISTATLTAMVRDGTSNGVGGAPVLFQLLGTTGSGESVVPAVAYSTDTGAIGQAVAEFRAGSLSTNGPVYVRASTVGALCTGTAAASYADEANPLCSTVAMTVSAAAVSMTIGGGTTITSVVNGTQYSLPFSVLVINTNGSPVANAVVSLSVFPTHYYLGNIAVDALSGACVVNHSPAVPFANEDLDRDAILDAGEDTSGNGLITPPQAAGGALPATVTTDINGVATFNLQYPKESALFIVDEIVARVTVSGTEGRTINSLPLAASVEDMGTALGTSCKLAGARSF